VAAGASSAAAPSGGEADAMRYVAFLRGINVGGHASIHMADLIKTLQQAGFDNVTTYVQSGNVIFDSGTGNTGAIAKKLEDLIETQFNAQVKVILRSKNEIATIVENNPLLNEPTIDISKLHVTLLASSPDVAVLRDLQMNKEANELYTIRGKEIFLYCPNGYGRTKLNNTAFENKLKVIATTRNWRTMQTILTLP
jgi:uncharacterized protein (DUF1697 family)